MKQLKEKFRDNQFLAEIFSITAGFLLALTFSLAVNTQNKLPTNQEFIDPIPQVAKPECKHLHRSQLDDACKMTLPPIEASDYSKYEDNVLYRQVYSVLWGATYTNGWDIEDGGHLGTDIPSAIGTPVVSMGHGKVVDAKNMFGYGNMVSVEYRLPDGESVFAVYAHLDSYLVAEGDEVVRGQQIGTVGESGFASGPHLHLEINTTAKYGRQWYPYLDCPEQDVVAQVNEGNCRYLMYEHSVDPIAFLNSYKHGEPIRVASTDNSPINIPDTNTPNTNTNSNPIVTEGTKTASTKGSAVIEDKRTKVTTPPDANPVYETENKGITISNTTPGTTLDTSKIYQIINDTIPRLDVSLLTPETQRFLQDYKVQIVHSLNTVVALDGDVTVTMHVKSRTDDSPYTGWMPGSFKLYANNTNVKVSPADVSYVDNGKVTLRIRGISQGASVVVVTVEDESYYAFPVVVR